MNWVHIVSCTDLEFLKLKGLGDVFKVLVSILTLNFGVLALSRSQDLVSDLILKFEVLVLVLKSKFQHALLVNSGKMCTIKMYKICKFSSVHRLLQACFLKY